MPFHELDHVRNYLTEFRCYDRNVSQKLEKKLSPEYVKNTKSFSASTKGYFGF